MERRLFGSGDIHILVIGDAMLDQYLWGDVTRISPEAPIPVVTVVNEEYRVGGAANVAANIVSLGGRATLFTPIGRDDAGQRLLDMVSERGVSTDDSLLRAGVRTSLKTRVVARNQQIVRVDREEVVPLCPPEVEILMSRMDMLHPVPSVVLLSDYNKGTITDLLARSVIKWARTHSIPVIVDPKPPHRGRYADATFITPNIGEARKLSGMAMTTQAEVNVCAEKLRRDLALEGVLVTQGAEGMTLAADGGCVHLPAVAGQSREVIDVSGAGDSVIAALGLAIAAEVPWILACQFANTVAGVAVQKKGTAVVTLDEVIEDRSSDAGCRIMKWLR